MVTRESCVMRRRHVGWYLQFGQSGNPWSLWAPAKSYLQIPSPRHIPSWTCPLDQERKSGQYPPKLPISSYCALADSSNVRRSTLHHRARRRCSVSPSTDPKQTDRSNVSGRIGRWLWKTTSSPQPDLQTVLLQRNRAPPSQPHHRPLTILVFIMGSSSSFKASLPYRRSSSALVAVVVRIVMHGRHANRYLESKRCIIPPLAYFYNYGEKTDADSY